MERPTKILELLKAKIKAKELYPFWPADNKLVLDYIETLEAERDTLKYKASQYDGVVAALKVAYGGRFRNDTIDALLSRLRQLEDEDEREA